MKKYHFKNLNVYGNEYKLSNINPATISVHARPLVQTYCLLEINNCFF